jgi:hypothetical protein
MKVSMNISCLLAMWLSLIQRYFSVQTSSAEEKINVERGKEGNTIPYNDILLCDAKESGHFIRNCFA